MSTVSHQSTITASLYLCNKIFLASHGVMKPLYQQCMELLEHQCGPFHLQGTLSRTAVRSTLGNDVSL